MQILASLGGFEIKITDLYSKILNSIGNLLLLIMASLDCYIADMKSEIRFVYLRIIWTQIIVVIIFSIFVIFYLTYRIVYKKSLLKTTKSCISHFSDLKTFSNPT